MPPCHPHEHGRPPHERGPEAQRPRRGEIAVVRGDHRHARGRQVEQARGAAERHVGQQRGDEAGRPVVAVHDVGSPGGVQRKLRDRAQAQAQANQSGGQGQGQGQGEQPGGMSEGMRQAGEHMERAGRSLKGGRSSRP